MKVWGKITQKTKKNGPFRPTCCSMYPMVCLMRPRHMEVPERHKVSTPCAPNAWFHVFLRFDLFFKLDQVENHFNPVLSFPINKDP